MALDNAKALYVEWLKLGTAAARRAAGQPVTHVEYAEKNGVSRAVLYVWKKDPEVRRAVADHGISLFTVDELTAARQMLVNRATIEGNTTAIRMMLEIAGLIGKNAQPQEAITARPDSLAKMSDAELEALLAEDDEDGE